MTIDELADALEAGELTIAERQPSIQEFRASTGHTLATAELVGKTIWVWDQATCRWSVAIAVEGVQDE